jgi:hypothetical protein
MTACVAFGPNESLLFNSQIKWSRGGLPADVEALFTGQNKVKEVFNLALAPDGSYRIVCQDANGLLPHSWMPCPRSMTQHPLDTTVVRINLPAGLEKWLVPSGNRCARDERTLEVALGPSNSYFANDKNGSAWGNLFLQMETAIKAQLDSKGRFKSG